MDIAPQPNYPFTFYQADAIDFARLLAGQFDFIHASPPCQAHSALNAVNERKYPDFIPATREVLKVTGRPFIIENVAGATIRKDVRLCGEMFGLNVLRHRHFETHGIIVTEPKHYQHRGRVAGLRHGEWFEGPYFAVYGEGGGKG